jgi:hypothetical protein
MVPMFTRVILSMVALLAVCGSLLAGAPALTSPPAGCHGEKAAVGCHGEADEAPQVAEASSGCHGRHRSTFAHRHASRVAGRSAARADRAADRSERAASRAGCHGATAVKVAGCHGNPQANATDDCD